MRDVRKQIQRNRNDFSRPAEEMPVFGTIASKFNDDGVTALYHALLETIGQKTGVHLVYGPRPSRRVPHIQLPDHHHSPRTHPLPVGDRRHPACLSQPTREPGGAVRRVWHLNEAAAALEEAPKGEGDVSAMVARLKNRGRQGAEGAGQETAERRGPVGADPPTYTPGRNWSTGARPKRCGQPLTSESLARQEDPQDGPARSSPSPAKSTAGCGARTCPATFPTPPGCFP